MFGLSVSGVEVGGDGDGERGRCRLEGEAEAEAEADGDGDGDGDGEDTLLQPDAEVVHNSPDVLMLINRYHNT